MSPNLNVVAVLQMVQAIAAERAAERAAVVAWLQTELEYMSAHDLTGGPMHMRGLIAGIERGEHRREEGR